MATIISYNPPYIQVKPDFYPSSQFKEVGGRWDKKLGVWLFPVSDYSFQWIKRVLGDKPYQVLSYPPQANLAQKYKPPQEPFKKFPLFSFQEDAANFLLTSPHKRSLLGLSKGLGKTLTTIAAIDQLSPNSILVVAYLPNVRTWMEELKLWIGEYPSVYHQGTLNINPRSSYIVTNYESIFSPIPKKSRKEEDRVTFTLDPFLNRDWDVLIGDESVLLKNRDASRTKAMKQLMGRAQYGWLLSGAPLTKYHDDLWAQLNMLLPSVFTSYWRFAQQYCVLQTTVWGTSVVGNRSDVSIYDDLTDIVYIRDSQQVGIQLPESYFETVYVDLELDQQMAYLEARDNFLLLLEDETLTIPNRMAQLTRLAQIVSEPANVGMPWSSGKLIALSELFQNREVELPCIIWTHWVKTAEAICTELSSFGSTWKVGMSHGGIKNNSQVIQDYKEGKLDILVCTLGTGKYGHTLINTQTMIFFDKHYDFDAYHQALGRTDERIGLDHHPLVVSFHCKGTTDDFIQRNLTSKSQSLASLTNWELSSLLRSLQ